MKRDHSSGDFDGALETDAVWELLRQRPAHRPGADFAAGVVRAARLEALEKPWWSRLWIPAGIGASLAGAAAIVTLVFTLQGNPNGSSGTVVTTAAPDASLSALQDDYETEVFIAASEHLGKFSDEELVSLIGF
jgi:hypothetical protein